jgi:hypothetical protein
MKMTELDVWADPDFAIGGDYIKFENVGDTVTGKVIAVRKHIWDDGQVSPQIIMDVDGEEKTVTAGQVRLKAALAEKRPQPGQHLTITMTEIEKRAGGKTLKHFDVQVGAPVAQMKPSAKAPVVESKYSAEQIEAMKQLGIEIPA